MSQKDSLAMATSAEQRQQGAGHALPADKATPHEQTQVGIATVARRADPCSRLCRCPVWWSPAVCHTMPDVILLHRLNTACASAVLQALMQSTQRCCILIAQCNGCAERTGCSSGHPVSGAEGAGVTGGCQAGGGGC